VTGSLAGKAVIVTGAGRGLGRAYAMAAAAERASVVVNDIDAASAAGVVAEISVAGGIAAASSDSVASWDGAERLVAACLDAFGAVDGLVNNAGVFAIDDPWDATEASARSMLEVNVLGAFQVGVHAMRAMRDEGGGSIVNCTSSAQFGIPRMAVYGATKAALAALVYSWALDLADSNVRVNAFSPVADTYMSHLGGIAPGVLPAPQDNAPGVVYLLSDLAAGITGQVVQFRPPGTLEVVGHPMMTGHAATIELATAAGVAEAFGPVLQQHQQPNGWGIGRS
jgi:NAD(P)-dependent dehydrogenase (short-subunit alcohol dehydrogenase family)